MFWDGSPMKQSFINVVGLSTPRASRTISRPSSAPARTAVRTPTVYSPPRGRLVELEAFGCGHTERVHPKTVGGQIRRVGQREHGKREPKTRSDHQRAGGNPNMARVRWLEQRLDELKQENATMRDAMFSKLDERKLEQLAQVQRRNHEVIAALHTAKDTAEKIARRTQARVRALQNELRKKNSKKESSPANPHRGLSCPGGRPAEGLDSKVPRPTSAPQPCHRAASNNHNAWPTEAEMLIRSMTTDNMGAPQSTRNFPSFDAFGGNGWANDRASGEAAAKTSPYESSRPCERTSAGGVSSLHHPKPLVVACYPELGTTSRRTPSPNLTRSQSTVATARHCEMFSGDARTNGSAITPVAFYQEAFREGMETTGKAEGRPHEERRHWERGAGGKEAGRVDDDARGDSRRTHRDRDVAPTVLLAREAEAAARREARAAAARQKEGEEIRQSSSFRAREFHATSGPDWATIKAHQEVVRKQRVRDRAALLAASSSLPPRMAKHAAMQEAAASGHASGSTGNSRRSVDGIMSKGRARFTRNSGDDPGGARVGESEEQASGRVGIDELEDIGRVMQRRQRRWEASLAAAKVSSRIAPTRPRTPPMEKRRLIQEAKRIAREKAERAAQEAAEKRQAEEERRHFLRLVAMHRDRGHPFKPTSASVKKAEMTRLKIRRDLEQKEQHRAAEVAEEARQREVSRAVREYVAASEARRREEHGAGPPLEELVRRKKDEKNAEFRERRKLNRSGIRQALRKRPNLLERQEKFAQLHSRRLAAKASAARDFLESSEGFSAAGRRALQPTEEVEWMAKAAADDKFSSKEKADLGLPVVLDGNSPRDGSECQSLHDGIAKDADSAEENENAQLGRERLESGSVVAPQCSRGSAEPGESEDRIATAEEDKKDGENVGEDPVSDKQSADAGRASSSLSPSDGGVSQSRESSGDAGEGIL